MNNSDWLLKLILTEVQILQCDMQNNITIPDVIVTLTGIINNA